MLTLLDTAPTPAVGRVGPTETVLAALAVRLAAAGEIAAEIRDGLAGGELLRALGTAVTAEQLLRDALALQAAAVVIHLEPPAS